MKTNKSFQLNIPISKVDEEQRIVTGIATSEALDSQGDIVDYEASKAAFAEWKGNIREMHGPVAIGKGIDVQFDDDSKQVIVSAKISESADGENAWTKVKEEILTGFSIGGRVFEMVKDKAVEGANRIMDYSLSELSLVDSPANPEAELIMVKSIDGNLQRVEQPQTREAILPEPWWAAKFLAPDMKKGGMAVKDGDARDEKAASTTPVINGPAPLQAGTIIPKKVIGADGKSVTNKSVSNAQEALSLATQLTWLIMIESDEPDQAQDLIDAFNSIRDFAGKELAEGDDFDYSGYADAIELANNAINLRKGKSMSDKKVEKTNVVAGEERNLDAEVTESAEQAGRPVNDTTERAAAAKVPAAGAAVDDDGKEVPVEEATQGADLVYADDDKTKTPDDTARNDITPPQDKRVIDPKAVTEPTNEQTIDAKPQTVNDTKQDRSPAVALPADPTEEEESDRDKSPKPTNTSEPKKDGKKSEDATTLLKNVETLLTKLNDEHGSAELKKAFGDVQKSVGEVAKSVDSLKDRVEALEKQPLPTKGKQYQVIGKGESEVENTELKELLKRQDELTADPSLAAPNEAFELAMKIRKAMTGEKITIN